MLTRWRCRPPAGPKIQIAAESQVSKSARPGAPPVFPLSTFKDNSRYTRAGDVGHPPIEGLLPENIRAAVYAAYPGVVDQAVNGAGKEKTSARNRLKKLILEQFKQTAVPEDEHYKSLYAVARQIDKALS
jgi:hypothetical protein